MNKDIEKRFNELETRLVHRFNTLLKAAQKREELENKRIEKMIDAKIAVALQQVSNKIEQFLNKNRKL